MGRQREIVSLPSFLSLLSLLLICIVEGTGVRANTYPESVVDTFTNIVTPPHVKLSEKQETWSFKLVGFDDNENPFLVQEGAEVLRKQKGILHVASVMGAWRSGKSTLANMMLGKHVFSVQSDVTRKGTDGVWGYVRSQESGDGSLVVLDFEGLYAPNRTEKYDSALFTVGALVSSQIVYNFMGPPTHRDIDDLEAMLRQATALATAVTPTQSNQPVASTLPPFTWVIQHAGKGSTQTNLNDWMASLFNRQKRRDGSTGSLTFAQNAFSGMHVLMASPRAIGPSRSQPEQGVPALEFTSAYLAGVADTVRSTLNMAYLGKGQTYEGGGAQFLLRAEAVIEGIAKGHLPNMIGRWDAFLKTQIEDIKTNQILRYETAMRQTLGRPPPAMGPFSEHHKTNRARAGDAYVQLLYGLETPPAVQGQRELLAAIDHKFIEITADRNRSLDTFIQSVANHTIEGLSAEVQSLTLPARSKELQAKLDSLIQEAQEQVSKAIVSYRDEAIVSGVQVKFEKLLKQTHQRALKENERLIKEELERLKDEALNYYREDMPTWFKVDPLTDEQLMAQHKRAMHTVITSFQQQAGALWGSEPAYEAATVALAGEGSQLLAQAQNRNKERIREKAELLRAELDKKSQALFEQQQKTLPQPPSTLEEWIKEHRNSMREELRVRMGGFRRHSEVGDVVASMDEEMGKTASELQERNMILWTEKCAQPLTRAYIRMQDLLPNYWFLYRARIKAAEIAKEELLAVSLTEDVANTVAKYWSESEGVGKVKGFRHLCRTSWWFWMWDGWTYLGVGVVMIVGVITVGFMLS